MKPQLHEFLSQHFAIRVNEKGEEVEKPEEGTLISGRHSKYNNAKEIIKLPNHGDLIETLLYSSVKRDKCFYIIVNYQLFVSEPLTLSMFVPVKDGKVLEEPESYQDYLRLEMISFCNLYTKKEELIKCQDYQTALKQVIFEGWEWNAHTPYSVFTDCLDIDFFAEVTLTTQGVIGTTELKTISDAIPFGLNLKV